MSTTHIDPDILKATIALPTIVAETLNLKRNGKLWTAPCPFHAERTPILPCLSAQLSLLRLRCAR